MLVGDVPHTGICQTLFLSFIVSVIIVISKMRAELANLNHCVVPFLMAPQHSSSYHSQDTRYHTAMYALHNHDITRNYR